MAKTSKIIKILQDQGNKAADDVAQMVIRRKTLLSQVLNGVSSDWLFRSMWNTLMTKRKFWPLPRGS
jgi:hypothetical protein